MTIQFYWFAPTSGDGQYVGTQKPERPPTLDYLVSIAQKAEEAHFDGILIPTGTPYLDAWMVGSAIIHATKSISPLVAFRPGFISPTVAAKMASTLDEFSRGRLMVNFVAGGSSVELGQDGDFLEHDLRYERADEFLDIITNLWKGQLVDYQSNFYKVEKANLIPKNYQNRNLPIYFGGSSHAAKEVAAKYANVYLQWGEPANEIRQQLQDVQERAKAYNRSLEFGIRIHIIVRDTEEEAWKAAHHLLSEVNTKVKNKMSTYYKEADSVAQKRMNDLLTGDYRFGKYKWAGIGTVRKGAGTAIVGTPKQVREGLQEYIDLGVTHFILSGYPHLEEVERFGELVMPLFKSNEVLA
ncbi:LLM class flavin-dependent oxidoreductase [Bacillus sp. XF8]|uniref:LLM class flavin-dependent oxidoreductase n=1 Tax=Bacillus sp. XF8 TaxID=2819289 RepID=UPI001AA02BAD|nr:LLM class flavin-dependent oxidoreductase [Bacillus sp. XF8]MBO1578748.1 LLM class flavin-dependent oxidoreductase [Bacillus sp. XF8]